MSMIDKSLREGDNVSSAFRSVADQRRVYANNNNIKFDPSNKNKSYLRKIDKKISKVARSNWKKSAHTEDRARDINKVKGKKWGKLSTKDQNKAIKHYLKKGFKVLEEGDHLHIAEQHGKKGVARFGSKVKGKIRTGATTDKVFGRKHKWVKKELQLQDEEGLGHPEDISRVMDLVKKNKLYKEKEKEVMSESETNMPYHIRKPVYNPEEEGNKAAARALSSVTNDLNMVTKKHSLEDFFNDIIDNEFKK